MWLQGWQKRCWGHGRESESIHPLQAPVKAAIDHQFISIRYEYRYVIVIVRRRSDSRCEILCTHTAKMASFTTASKLQKNSPGGATSLALSCLCARNTAKKLGLLKQTWFSIMNIAKFFWNHINRGNWKPKTPLGIYRLWKAVFGQQSVFWINFIAPCVYALRR